MSIYTHARIKQLMTGVLLVGALVGVINTQAANSQSAELKDFSNAIRDKYDLKERAFRENDVEALVNGFYARDALLVEEHKVVKGYDQVLAMYQELVPATESVSIKSYHTYLAEQGNMGYDYTTFHVNPVKGEDFDLKLLFIWEKVKGEWRCKSDMYIIGAF